MSLDTSFRNLIASNVLGVLYEYRKLPLELALLRVYLDPEKPVRLFCKTPDSGKEELAFLKYNAQENKFICKVIGNNLYAGEHDIIDPITFDLLSVCSCEQYFGSFQEGGDPYKDKKFKLYIKDLLFYERNQLWLLAFCYLKCFNKSIIKLGNRSFASIYLACRKVNGYHIKYGSAGRWQVLSLMDRLELIDDLYTSVSVEVLLDV